MENGKVHQQAYEITENKADNSITSPRSRLGKLISEIKNRVKIYRQDHEGQVYMNSNFRLDN